MDSSTAGIVAVDACVLALVALAVALRAMAALTNPTRDAGPNG